MNQISYNWRSVNTIVLYWLMKSNTSTIYSYKVRYRRQHTPYMTFVRVVIRASACHYGIRTDCNTLLAWNNNIKFKKVYLCFVDFLEYSKLYIFFTGTLFHHQCFSHKRKISDYVLRQGRECKILCNILSYDLYISYFSWLFRTE